MKNTTPIALYWVGSARKDLKRLPDPVQDTFGYALHLAQSGGHHEQAKVLKGFHGTGVMEVVEDHDGNAYTAVYTVRFADAVYVLHCFQKKSPSGIRTTRNDTELIRQRLKVAEQHSKEQHHDRHRH
ncbi:MAG: type II toxin-antitoxin system RelE/ParE family toxin [Pseudomonadota bacterium]